MNEIVGIFFKCDVKSVHQMYIIDFFNKSDYMYVVILIDCSLTYTSLVSPLINLHVVIKLIGPWYLSG